MIKLIAGIVLTLVISATAGAAGYAVKQATLPKANNQKTYIETFDCYYNKLIKEKLWTINFDDYQKAVSVCGNIPHEQFKKWNDEWEDKLQSEKNVWRESEEGKKVLADKH